MKRGLLQSAPIPIRSSLRRAGDNSATRARSWVTMYVVQLSSGSCQIAGQPTQHTIKVCIIISDGSYHRGYYALSCPRRPQFCMRPHYLPQTAIGAPGASTDLPKCRCSCATHEHACLKPPTRHPMVPAPPLSGEWLTQLAQQGGGLRSSSLRGNHRRQDEHDDSDKSNTQRRCHAHAAEKRCCAIWSLHPARLPA